MFIFAEYFRYVLCLELLLWYLFVVRNACGVLIVSEVLDINEGDCAGGVVDAGEEALELLSCF